jgi:hypothetical protein
MGYKSELAETNDEIVKQIGGLETIVMFTEEDIATIEILSPVTGSTLVLKS